jgi:hypothetical protein
MTRFIDRPQNTEMREVRVRVPQHMSAPIFQGWGPKF